MQKVVGATAFIAQVCRDLGIADKVNRMVEWDQKQWKLSPGTRVVALIINIICHRQPLYRVWEFYEHLDLGLLFDQPVTLEDLNDDGFARTLDRLHASGELRRLVHTVALAAVRASAAGYPLRPCRHDQHQPAGRVRGHRERPRLST